MKGILVIGFSILSFTSFSQSNQLSFKEAVKIGLENNLTLNQQENLLISSQVSKTSAMLGMGPTVRINGNAGRNDGNSFNQQEGEVVNGVIDFIGANITANMPLFNGLNSMNSFRQASQQYEAQLHFVNRTNQDVITNIANQFLTCLLDQRLVSIREKNLETQKQQFNQISEQVSAGSRAEVDLLRQEYEVKNAELFLLRANIVLKNDKATLAQTLGIDPSVSFEVVEPNWDVNIEDGTSIELKQLYETADSRRSDLAQARALEKASEFGYMASKGSYYPNVSLFAQYGSQYNYIHPTPNFSPDNRTFEDQFTKDNTQLAYGITFSIPIFQAFRNKSNVVTNRSLYENAKLTKRFTELTVKSDVLRAYQNYRDARSNYETSTAQLKAAELSFLLEQERFSLGVSDIVALTLANQNYTSAQADFENSKYTLMFQRILLNYATGTLKFEDIP
jgi:outer membrane protein